jgi:hypothetical protein
MSAANRLRPLRAIRDGVRRVTDNRASASQVARDMNRTQVRHVDPPEDVSARTARVRQGRGRAWQRRACTNDWVACLLSLR